MPSEETTYRDSQREKLDRIENKIDAVDKKVSYTNGKVKRITIALVLIAGVLIGQNFTSVHDIIALLAGRV